MHEESKSEDNLKQQVGLALAEIEQSIKKISRFKGERTGSEYQAMEQQFLTQVQAIEDLESQFLDDDALSAENIEDLISLTTQQMPKKSYLVDIIKADNTKVKLYEHLVKQNIKNYYISPLLLAHYREIQLDPNNHVRFMCQRIQQVISNKHMPTDDKRACLLSLLDELKQMNPKLKQDEVKLEETSRVMLKQSMYMCEALSDYEVNTSVAGITFGSFFEYTDYKAYADTRAKQAIEVLGKNRELYAAVFSQNINKYLNKFGQSQASEFRQFSDDLQRLIFDTGNIEIWRQVLVGEVEVDIDVPSVDYKMCRLGRVNANNADKLYKQIAVILNTLRSDGVNFSKELYDFVLKHENSGFIKQWNETEAMQCLREVKAVDSVEAFDALKSRYNQEVVTDCVNECADELVRELAFRLTSAKFKISDYCEIQMKFKHIGQGKRFAIIIGDYKREFTRLAKPKQFISASVEKMLSSDASSDKVDYKQKWQQAKLALQDKLEAEPNDNTSVANKLSTLESAESLVSTATEDDIITLQQELNSCNQQIDALRSTILTMLTDKVVEYHTKAKSSIHIPLFGSSMAKGYNDKAASILSAHKQLSTADSPDKLVSIATCMGGSLDAALSKHVGRKAYISKIAMTHKSKVEVYTQIFKLQDLLLERDKIFSVDNLLSYEDKPKPGA